MDQSIRDFLQAKRLAVVGVSRSKMKFGSVIYRELKQRGFEVYGVNPQLENIDGERCYASIGELRERVDGVVICVSPQQAAGVLRQAANAGMRNIWLQQGSQSDETHQAAREAGVTPVEGKCILLYAGKVNSYHAFHKLIAKLIGQY